MQSNSCQHTLHRQPAAVCLQHCSLQIWHLVGAQCAAFCIVMCPATYTRLCMPIVLPGVPLVFAAATHHAQVTQPSAQEQQQGQVRWLRRTLRGWCPSTYIGPQSAASGVVSADKKRIAASPARLALDGCASCHCQCQRTGTVAAASPCGSICTVAAQDTTMDGAVGDC